MEFFANYPASTGVKPDVWAREKEAQGWHGICASDHLWVGATRYPHVFVAATQMACATTRTLITTSFCNNLFRSPVEFAQAALSLQAASGGRFEAGLGAGWLQDEIEAMGDVYPSGPERVSRYVEALTVVRSLLATGQCDFQGDHYQVRIQGEHALGLVTDSPPPLIASAGGPRALREVAPLVDRVEVKASARATRVGYLDFEIMATVTEEEVRGQVERVRAVNADVPLGIFILTGTGDNPAVKGLKAALANGYLSRFVGEPEQVAEALNQLGEIGIDRVQLTELVPGSHAELAPYLLSG
ncbi:MAG TPA: LLM class flavin-dependent oxidoreductase [Pseudomonadales bacterium]|jgi:alkanesulfonate monooxygenase SsuD/methylene tetrahydromethanopterin reductase-like flavin-dependent oxidoreductase (luciferase family)